MEKWGAEEKVGKSMKFKLTLEVTSSSILRNRRRGPFSGAGANRPLKSHSNIAPEVGSTFKRVASYKSTLLLATMPYHLFVYSNLSSYFCHIKRKHAHQTRKYSLAMPRQDNKTPLPITKTIKSNQIRPSLIPFPLMPRNSKCQTRKEKAITGQRGK